VEGSLLTFVSGGGGKARRKSRAVAHVTVPAGTATSQLPADRKFVAVGRVALDERVMSAVRHPCARRSHRRRTTERCMDKKISLLCQQHIAG